MSMENLDTLDTLAQGIMQKWEAVLETSMDEEAQQSLRLQLDEAAKLGPEKVEEVCSEWHNAINIQNDPVAKERFLERIAEVSADPPRAMSLAELARLLAG